VKPGTEIRVNLAASIHEWRGFYLDLRIREAGYAWAAWKMGCLFV
jgi:hypothetical protein